MGLQASQSTVAGLITLVRGQAAVSGRNAALFVCSDSTSDPDRVLRYLVPVVRNPSGSSWTPLNDGVFLPPGCYVVPYETPTGTAIEDGVSWAGLNSSRLHLTETLAINSALSDEWIGVEFTSFGTPTPSVGSGIGTQIVLANGRRLPPGSDPPYQLLNPENVRGVLVSIYGNMILVDSKDAFE